MNNLIQRTITGIVFVGIIIFSILFHKFTFLAIFAAIVFGTLIEFYSITKNNTIVPQKIFGAIVGTLTFAILFFIASGELTTSHLSLLIPFALAIFIIELYKKGTNPINNLAYTLFGIIYIAMPFALMSFLLSNTNHDFAYNSKLLVAFFVMVWANDTFAYLSGKMLGKHFL